MYEGSFYLNDLYIIYTLNNFVLKLKTINIQLNKLFIAYIPKCIIYNNIIYYYKKNKY